MTNKKFEGAVVNPFSEDFQKHWDLWKQYKTQDHKFTFKSAMSEQAGLNELVDLSDGDEQEAARIINRSIAQGWKGLFRIHKSKKDGKSEPATKKATGGTSVDELKVAYSRRNGTEG